MRRSNPYHALKWIVQVKWPNKPFYENIAAFDSERIANEYADDAAERARKICINFAYRVCERQSDGKLVVKYITENRYEQ